MTPRRRKAAPNHMDMSLWYLATWKKKRQAKKSQDNMARPGSVRVRKKSLGERGMATVVVTSCVALTVRLTRGLI